MHEQGPYKTVHYDFDSDELTPELVTAEGILQQPTEFSAGILSRGGKEGSDGTSASRRQP
jgi:hypothetical protein